MATNILNALTNLVNNPITELLSHYSSKTRANNMGDALELYVKDLFCGSLEEPDFNKKDEIHRKNFSYLGNQNNPPDFMIKGGDAVEVKKIQTYRASLALNSSYPKDKLFSNSPMITQACRECEKWTEKDMIYIVGVVNEKYLKSLWLVYGNCYAAEKNIYEKTFNQISTRINEIPDLKFDETDELGRVNKVDPLGITYLRIRGMWGIDNPASVFEYVVPFDKKAKFSVNTIMLTSKYASFPESDRTTIENLVSNSFSINDVQIKSPNNPAAMLGAKHLVFIK